MLCATNHARSANHITEGGASVYDAVCGGFPVEFDSVRPIVTAELSELGDYTWRLRDFIAIRISNVTRTRNRKCVYRIVAANKLELLKQLFIFAYTCIRSLAVMRWTHWWGPSADRVGSGRVTGQILLNLCGSGRVVGQPNFF